MFAATNVQEDHFPQSSIPQQQQQEEEMQYVLVQSDESENNFRRNVFNIKRDQQGKQAQQRVLSQGYTYGKAVENLSDLQMKEQQNAESYNLR